MFQNPRTHDALPEILKKLRRAAALDFDQAHPIPAAAHHLLAVHAEPIIQSNATFGSSCVIWRLAASLRESKSSPTGVSFNFVAQTLDVTWLDDEANLFEPGYWN